MAYLTGPSGLLTFLDTNVVQNLHTFGEFIYRGNLSQRDEQKLSSSRMRDDIFALRHLANMGRRFGWPLAVSLTNMDEFVLTKDPSKRYNLVSWWGELAEYFEDNYKEWPPPESGSAYSEITHFTPLQRNWLYDHLNVLPDEKDRVLVVDALELGCNVFLTMDYRTIWVHREEVRRLGIHVMRPVEFLQEPVLR